MGFLKVCLYLALIVGCGFFLVHNLPDHSPSASSPSRQAHPHFIRPIPRPPSNNGGIFSDRNVLDNLGGVIGYGGLACLAAFLLWRGISEYRDWGEWTAFIPLVVLAVLVGGLASWFGYFGEHDMLLIWPIVVSLVFFVLLMFRAAARDRQRREEAEAMRQFDKTPVHGYSQEATPDDERRFGL